MSHDSDIPGSVYWQFSSHNIPALNIYHTLKHQIPGNNLVFVKRKRIFFI